MDEGKEVLHSISRYSQIDILILEIMGEESATITSISNQFKAETANPFDRPPQRPVPTSLMAKSAQSNMHVVAAIDRNQQTAAIAGILYVSSNSHDTNLVSYFAF